MGEMETITEHELRERLWASGDGVDSASLTGLADDALRQAGRQRRALRAGATLSTALVVAAVGVGVSTMAGGPARPASAPVTSAGPARQGPVKLVTPILLATVVSSTAGACEKGGYPAAITLGSTIPSCYQVDSAHALTLDEVETIYATPQTAVGPNGSTVTGVQGDNGVEYWEVPVRVLSTDKPAYTRLTTATVNRQLAIIVDGKVMDAPELMDPITDGTFMFGGVSQQEATALVRELTGK